MARPTIRFSDVPLNQSIRVIAQGFGASSQMLREIKRAQALARPLNGQRAEVWAGDESFSVVLPTKKSLLSATAGHDEKGLHLRAARATSLVGDTFERESAIDRAITLPPGQRAIVSIVEERPQGGFGPLFKTVAVDRPHPLEPGKREFSRVKIVVTVAGGRQTERLVSRFHKVFGQSQPKDLNLAQSAYDSATSTS